MPIRKPTLLNPPVTSIPTDMLDALVNIFGDSAEVAQWATPTLIRAWRSGAIDRVQWDGHHYIPANHVGEGERTFSITGWGLVCELKRAVQGQLRAEHSGDNMARMKSVRMIALLAGAIGVRKGSVAAPAPIPSPDHAIYVDEIIHWGNKPAPGAERFFGNGKPSCHMSTPDHSPAGLAALHRFAQSLGMQRAWFQDETVMPHYDLTPSKRALALKAGAVSVTGQEIVTKCGRKHIREMLAEVAS